MIGHVLSLKYEILEEIESGPVFTAYRAKDRTGGREVKIRIVNGDMARDPEFLDSLRRVVSRGRELSHPGIERVLDLDEDEDIWYVVSEYAPGAALDDRLRRLSSFSVPVALSAIIQIAEALESVHADGVVHGDIAAKTVISSQADSVKLTLPGFWEAYSHNSKAAVGMLKGMSPYLAPEITAGAMPSVQSDIYAVGVLMYQMLAGRFPYPGDTPVAIATKHASSPYPSLRNTSNSVPVALDEVVRKAMSKAPGDRYHSVRALLADLRTMQDALRFGRSISWPLQPAEPNDEPEPVAPDLNAVNPPQKDQTKVKRKKRLDSDGIPGWLAGLGYVTTVLAVLAIGGWFYFNIQRPKPIPVPNLIGKSATEAGNELKALGLNLRVVRREPSDQYGEGIILDLAPKPGEDVLEHAYVEAIVSAGSRFVEIPDLRGRTIDEARSLLESMNLDLADQVEYVRDRDLDEGMIVSQVPEARKRIERFSKIRVKVSSGPRGNTSGDLGGGLHKYMLRLTMPAGDGVPVMMRVDMTDDNETQTIHEAEHAPGEVVEVEGYGYGTEVTFRVFINGEPVKQITQSAKDAVESIPDGT